MKVLTLTGSVVLLNSERNNYHTFRVTPSQESRLLQLSADHSFPTGLHPAVSDPEQMIGTFIGNAVLDGLRFCEISLALNVMPRPGDAATTGHLSN